MPGLGVNLRLHVSRQGRPPRQLTRSCTSISRPPELPLMCDGALRRRQSLSFPASATQWHLCVFPYSTHTVFFFLAIPLSMWDFIYSFIWLHWVSVTALRILVPWSLNPCPLHEKRRVLTMGSQGRPQIIFFLFLTGRIFGEVNLFLCKETEKLNDPPTCPQPWSRVEQPYQKCLRPLPPHLVFRK